MNFSIDYPTGMVQPKGLHIPRFEDIDHAVCLAEMVLSYVKIPDSEDYVFTVMVTDEVFIHQGKLAGISDTGEGVNLYPSPSAWTTETIFESILHGLFDGGSSSCWGDCCGRSPSCGCSQ